MGTSEFELISLCYYVVVVNEKDDWGEIGPTPPDSIRVLHGWYTV